MPRITRGPAARQANAFEEIFGGFIAANQRLASGLRGGGANQQPARPAAADWRAIERLLIDFLQSHRIDTGDAAGDPTIEIVRYHEGDEVDTTRVSLERLARYLADEIK